MSSELWVQREHPSCLLQAGWGQECAFLGSERYFSSSGGKVIWKNSFKLAQADVLTEIRKTIKEGNGWCNGVRYTDACVRIPRRHRELNCQAKLVSISDSNL